MKFAVNFFPFYKTISIDLKYHFFLILGLIEVPVFSAADAYHVMGVGRKNLHVAATKLNEHSSRSHSIFTIKLVKISHNKEAMVTQ